MQPWRRPELGVWYHVRTERLDSFVHCCSYCFESTYLSIEQIKLVFKVKSGT